MLTYLLIALAVLLAILAVFAIFVATRPSEFVVTRAGVISDKPERVFALVNDFREWDHWSPWAKLDPTCKNSFDGSASGVGAKFAWDGNNQVGQGRMQITESRPYESIKLDLIFNKPMKATNLTAFSFKPEGGGTRVTWTMSGSNGFVGKLFNLVMNCDKMVGGQFEQGFDNMNAIVKARA